MNKFTEACWEKTGCPGNSFLLSGFRQPRKGLFHPCELSNSRLRFCKEHFRRFVSSSQPCVTRFCSQRNGKKCGKEMLVTVEDAVPLLATPRLLDLGAVLAGRHAMATRSGSAPRAARRLLGWRRRNGGWQQSEKGYVSSTLKDFTSVLGILLPPPAPPRPASSSVELCQCSQGFSQPILNVFLALLTRCWLGRFGTQSFMNGCHCCKRLPQESRGGQ